MYQYNDDIVLLVLYVTHFLKPGVIIHFDDPGVCYIAAQV